jgi:DNA-binding XRE family transcriptional regulator
MNKPSAFVVYTAISGCLNIQYVGDASASPATNRVLTKSVVVEEKTGKKESAGDFDDFLEELERNPQIAADINKGREWLATLEEESTLRQLRLRAGLSQKDLASRIGLKQPNISEMEAGRRTPSAEIMLKLSKVLRVSGDELLAIFGKPDDSNV